MRIKLTTKQKIKLELQHKGSRDKRKCDRIKAVLLTDEGWCESQISQALRIHQTTVNKYVIDFHNEKKLSSESGGS